MRFIRKMISPAISYAVILSLMVLSLPFMKMAMGGMLDTYGTMATAVLDGNGGEYADNMLTEMEAGSQVILDGVGEWAFGTIEQIGGSDLLTGLSDFFSDLS